MLRPYRAEAMRAYPVSPLVNSPKNDDARCLEAANAATA
jgi:putative SOS response-associated peptidase YedK